ncbi:MAG: hypothetical protein VCD00_07035 [Candidatus Hydrogenedentota bacterium]
MSESDPKEPEIDEESASNATESDTGEPEGTSGDAHLDRILSEGILKGQKHLDKAQTLLAAFMIFATGWVTYTAMLGSPFLLEETEAIVEVLNLHHVATVSRGWNDTIGPVSALTMAIDWTIGDGSPVLFQTTQLTLHLFNAILVFLLCRRLLGSRESEAIAMMSGFLFALHPVASHAVTMLTERDVLLATFFMFSSLLLFLSAVRGERVGLTRYVLALCAFALAWVCGHWTWITPILIVLMMATEHGLSGLLSRIKYLLPAVVLTLVLNYYPEPTMEAPLSLSGLAAESSYVGLAELAWLSPFATDWIYESDALGGTPGFIVIALMALGLLSFTPLPQKYRVFGLAFSWATLVMIGFGVATDSDDFNNAHLYPAGLGAGLFWIAIIAAIPAGTPRNVGGIVAAALLLAFAWITNERNVERKDEVFYWARANDACTTCYEPKIRLATLYHREGDTLHTTETGSAKLAAQNRQAETNWKWAAGFYKEARAENASLDGKLGSYARLRQSLGETDQAIQIMESAVALEPHNLRQLRALADWYGALFVETKNPANLRAALDYYDVIEAQGMMNDADRLGSAINYAQLGLPVESIERLRAIQDVEMRRQAQEIAKQLQPRLAVAKRHEDAFNEAAQAQKPRDELLRQRVPQLTAEGRMVNARYFAEELLRTTGNTVGEDWLMLGALYAMTGEWDALQNHWPPPSGLQQPWRTLATRLARQQNWQGALDALRTGFATTSQDPRPEAILALGKIAFELENVQQAIALYQQMAREYPTRKEPFLALVDIAIEQKQTNGVAEMLDRAQANGATQIEVESRRSRAGQIETATPETLQPFIIR